MRRLLPLALFLLGVACSSPAPLAASEGPWRLLLAGTVDLAGRTADVAEADPEGALRDLRLAARRADVAVVTAAQGEAGPLLAAAGFDLVACPSLQQLPAPATPAAIPGLLIECGDEAGTGEPAARSGLSLVLGAGSALRVTALPAASPGGPSLRVEGLGHLLGPTGAEEGAVVEALVDEAGVVAYRIGRTGTVDRRAHFSGWDPPAGDAVLLDGEWWTAARPVTPATAAPVPAPAGFGFGEVTAVAVGDITGHGRPDLAVSYRHPFRPSALSERWPGVVGVDAAGRSAHLGVFTLSGEALWAAGLIPHPVGALAACDGAVALAYTGLDDPTVVATGAAVWDGLALRPAPELPGTGTPGCADVDGDGRLDPVILGRPS